MATGGSIDTVILRLWSVWYEIKQVSNYIGVTDKWSKINGS